MNTFFEPLKEIKEYDDIVTALRTGKTPIQVTGCVDCEKAHFMASLFGDYSYKIIVMADELRAKQMWQDLRMYDRETYIYPAKDVIFYSVDIHGNAIIKDRMTVLSKIMEGKPITIITTVESGMDNLLPLEYLHENVIDVALDDDIDLEIFQKKLVQLGYSRVVQVEAPGEFAVRGGIIDIFILTQEAPYRIELWDTTVDTIRSFDVESQRSIENVDSISIYPATEIILGEDVLIKGMKKIEADCVKHAKTLRDAMKSEEAARIEKTIRQFKENVETFSSGSGTESFIKYFYKDTVSFFDYFTGRDTIVFVDEAARIEEKGNAVAMEFDESMKGRLEKGYILPAQVKSFYSFNDVMYKIAHMNTVAISLMDYNIKNLGIKTRCMLTTKSVPGYTNNFEQLVQDLKNYKNNGYRVILVCASRTRAARIATDLREEELNAYESDDLQKEVQPREIKIVHGFLRRGFEYPMIKFVVISDSDIFGEVKKKKKKKKFSGREISSFTDLNVGDYVVHENHGLGVYKGIEKIEVDNVVKDYIKIEYADGGNLYVLASGLDVIQKYASSDAKAPKLNKLNSPEWKKTKSKVATAVKDIAKDLVKLYAMRQEKNGFEFSKDNLWQHEFEEMFPFEETQDQLDAIEATKKDMESNRIMDRLICGDVGYGKTEVAIRAAFKAVQDNKQVAFLVPTTILAQQHYNTIVQRMKDYPVNIEMLSRFRTPKQQKAAIEGLKNGRVDIVIGTHRLLSKDIEFKRLGLLIIDEEQRFGVAHKEKIKQMKENIDVLALSATPIPRTLHMSLVGIRDMSVLEEPPIDRLPIQTYVLEHNDEMIREAINRELARNGQVYYVYNRVNTIVEITNHIASLVPDANVAYAHGQMSERELENIMFGFINGEIDVLVSTTIVETGLDISNVNTIIIDDADRFGLSQLYQLRGRVGRSNRTAYAFLMYKRDKILREEAEKRLQAIKEFTELGSGFKIAMKDLEIRGAGNLLGSKQHGHMAAVGYDLYCKMLNEAVLEYKGEKPPQQFDTTVELEVSAYIPASYIKSEYVKLDMYKRIADIETREEYESIQDELVDRFGEYPAVVNNLINVAWIKAMAHGCDIVKVKQKGNEIRLDMYEKARVDVNAIPQYLKENNGKVKFVAGQTPHFTVNMTPGKKKTTANICNFFDELIVFLDDFKQKVIL